MAEHSTPNRLILVVDDHDQIHEDFRSILHPVEEDEKFAAAVEEFFGEVPNPLDPPFYELESARQGVEAVEKVQIALEADQPFAVGFVDMRMPPGIDGLETIARIRKHDPDIQLVLCSAYSDIAWDEVYQRFGPQHNLVFLRKPFDANEVRQLALALTEKWNHEHDLAIKLLDLERLATLRTQELQQANDTIQEYSEHLEDLLEEQTRQLIKTERQALFGQLVQGIVHNLKNPLTIASGNARLVKMAVEQLKHYVEPCRDDQGEQCATCADDIDRFIQNMEQAIGNLNDMVMSLMERSRTDISTTQKVIDLNDLVQAELQFMTADPFFKKEVTKHVSLSEGELPVQVVAGDMAQVIGNLVRNAMEAMYDLEDPELYIRTEADHSMAVLTLRDNGPGISNDIKHRIFEPFFTTKKMQPDEIPDPKKPKGTGLGLWMVRESLDGCGGSIELTKSNETGAEFVVKLPLKME